MTKLVAFLSAWMALAAAPALAAPVYGLDHPDRIPDEYIVVLKADQHAFSAANDMSVRHRGQMKHAYQFAMKGFSVKLKKRDLDDLARDARVAYVEADRVVRLRATQTSATWGLDRIDQRNLPLDGSYTYGTDAASVNAYIIDTGIRLGHNEFGVRAQSGFTAIQDGRGTDDCSGHGTHVAGTVGGATYGVAKRARLYAVRVLDCDGRGSLSGVIAGIDWVTSNHLRPAVANMSLGGGSSRSLDDAVRSSISAGVTYVVAAGNENTDACTKSPARVAEAITVGATTRDDTRASYSNYGSCVDLFAPGSAITSAWIRSNSSTSTISGTSMAAPHVAGVAALYLAAQPNATPGEVASALNSTATPNVLSGLGSGSPNRLLYAALTGPSEPPPSAGACPTGYESYQGNLSTAGATEFQPNGTYFYANPGTLTGNLSGPSGTDFDLYLWNWRSGIGWVVLATSTSSSSNESISLNQGGGYYVWRVTAYRGTGAYTFCMKRR